MKICPNCRIESRIDADWCWHCGYSFEDEEPTGSKSRPADDRKQGSERGARRVP